MCKYCLSLFTEINKECPDTIVSMIDDEEEDIGFLGTMSVLFSFQRYESGDSHMLIDVGNAPLGNSGMVINHQIHYCPFCGQKLDLVEVD